MAKQVFEKQIDRDAAAQALGYSSWEDATDYRLNAEQNRQVAAMVHAFAVHREESVTEQLAIRIAHHVVFGLLEHQAPDAVWDGLSPAVFDNIAKLAVERNAAETTTLRDALEPFAAFAASNVDEHGWNDIGISTCRERVVDWFGPTDFRNAEIAWVQG